MNPIKQITLYLAFAGSAVSMAIAVPTHARAQEHAVTRQTYPFYTDRLDVEVLATSAGRLQIIRGGLGRVEVAAYAANGVAAFGLSDEPHVLRLTALGAAGADYVIVVPDNTSVSVRLPGQRGFQPSARYGSKTYRWNASVEAAAPDVVVPQHTLDGRFFVVTTRVDAPARVRLLDVEHIRSVEVRLEGTEFRIASSRLLRHAAGSASTIDIDPAGDAVDVVIQVPSYTEAFDLRMGTQSIVLIKNGKLSELCRPVVRQEVGGYTRLTYRPARGVSCSAEYP